MLHRTKLAALLCLASLLSAVADEFYSWRLPITLNAPAAGECRVPLTAEQITAWLNENDVYGFRPEDLAYDAVRLVERESGRVLEAGFVLRPGQNLVVNGDFSDGLNGWSAGGPGFTVKQENGQSYLSIEGADRTPLMQRIPTETRTWYQYAQRVRGAAAAAPHIQRQGESWQPVDRSWYDPYVPRGEWYSQRYCFYTGEKADWDFDELRVQIERFTADVDDVEFRRCETVFVWNARQAGPLSCWLEVAPHGGTQSLPPSHLAETLPAATAALTRTGDPDLRNISRRYLLPETSSSLTLWAAQSTEKILPDEAAPMNQRSHASLQLARGEGEAIQLVLRTTAAATLSQVKVSDLTGINVEIRQAKYVPITVPSQPDYGRNGRSTFTGRLPDPLPLFASTDLKPSENTLIWLDFQASRGAPAGPQTATVSLTLGDETIQATIELEVWDFTLPETPGVRMALQFTQYANVFLFPYHKVETREDKHRLTREYFAVMAKYRLGAKGPASGSVWADGDDALERELEWALDEQHQTAFTIGHVSGNPLANTTETEAKTAAATYDDVVAMIRRRGWLDRAIIQIDEPQPHAYTGVRQWIDGFRHRPETAGVRFLGFVYHAMSYDGIGESIDILTPLNNDQGSVVSPMGIAKRPAGSETWFYYTRTAHQWIDAPGLSQRFWAPSVHAWGGTGMAVWGINQWWAISKDSPHIHYNPWENPISTWGNGSLAYFYPPSRLGKELPEKDFTVVPSLRLLLTRDGEEDVEYALFLQRLIARGQAQKLNVSSAQAVLAEFRRPFITPTRWALCDDWWFDYRQRMVGEILDLQRQLDH